MTSNAPEIMLTGRKVLVTGGARGLGEAFARALVTAGASHHWHSVRNRAWAVIRRRF